MQIIYQCSACGDQFTSESYLHLHVNRGNHHALNIQLLELLAKNGPRTSSQLGKEIGVPRVTIIDALANLIARGKVKKYPAYQAEQGRGRPPILFSIAGASDPEPRWQWDWACDEVVARLKALPNALDYRPKMLKDVYCKWPSAAWFGLTNETANRISGWHLS